jgi:hypothetical protein
MPPPEAAYLASKIFRQNHMQRSCIWSLPGDKAAFVAPVSASIFRLVALCVYGCPNARSRIARKGARAMMAKLTYSFVACQCPLQGFPVAAAFHFPDPVLPTSCPLA